ncbi:hypothetical protein C4578_03380 [Candidatus Microgenomates bacterium]|jgi:hypothetical protein|nr:MAG: hypothetical protein C4578_03380 [Candidatus Microgenomates bacterium]
MPNKEIDRVQFVNREDVRVELLRKESLDLRSQLEAERILARANNLFFNRNGQILGYKSKVERSLYLLTPIGVSLESSLRSGIKIVISPTTRAIYEGPRYEEQIVRYESVPGFECEGYHFLTIGVYAGFEDINGPKYMGDLLGKREYLTNNDLRKEGRISAHAEIVPVNRDLSRFSKHIKIYDEPFNRDNFSVEEERASLIHSLGNYLSYANLNEAIIQI